MAHDYLVPPEERSLPAPDAVGGLLPMLDGSMQPHGDDDSSHGFTTEVQRQALCLDVVPVIAPTSCSRVEKDPKEPHGMRRYCANNGCSSILGPGWQYLRCRMCLKPPPPAQPSGDHDSSHELTTEVQQALSVDVAPVVAPTSCGGVEEDPKEPTPTQCWRASGLPPRRRWERWRRCLGCRTDRLAKAKRNELWRQE